MPGKTPEMHKAGMDAGVSPQLARLLRAVARYSCTTGEDLDDFVLIEQSLYDATIAYRKSDAGPVRSALVIQAVTAANAYINIVFQTHHMPQADPRGAMKVLAAVDRELRLIGQELRRQGYHEEPQCGLTVRGTPRKRRPPTPREP